MSPPAGDQPEPALPAAPVILPSQPDYEVLQLIGRGGYGEVYLTRGRNGAYHAVKVVYRVNFDDDRPYEREYNGIVKFEPVSRRSASQLQILHVGRRDSAGYFYYLMELADDMASGRTIHSDTYQPHTLKGETRRRGRIPVADCCQIGIGLAVALENLHAHGLVHRDIKPSNIVFVNGHPKLADVGLVTNADLTVSCAGTEGYMPPEGPGSFRGDLYSLGKVLYEIATGMDRLEFPRLPDNLSELPDHETFLDLNAIIAQACQADVRKRYQSAQELRRDLEFVARGRSIRHRKRPRVIAAVVALLACVVGTAIIKSVREASDALPVSLEVLRTARSVGLTDHFNATTERPWQAPGGRMTLAVNQLLPLGVRVFDGTAFEVRGLIQLSGRAYAKAGNPYPEAVRGIPVNRKCTRLHFLHACVGNVPEGLEIGSYVLHYADGQQRVLPISYGPDVRHWNARADPKRKATRSDAIWTARDSRWQARLFKTTRDNPRPAEEISRLDFIGNLTDAAPFLVAITVE